MKIAVVGSGIAGLGAAWALSHRHDVTLYERENRLGGHARTIDIVAGGELIPVDTGFIVYNERNYPNLSALLTHHGVATQAADMSLSVSDGDFEFSPNVGALVSDPRQALSRRSLGIMRGVLRFRRELENGGLGSGSGTIADQLRQAGYPEPFLTDYLIPLAAAVWSGSATEAASMPAATLTRFFSNHGLFELPRPEWRTVSGGSRGYVDHLVKEIPRVFADTSVRAVERVAGGVTVVTDDGQVRYDHVVLATHAPTSLELLSDATPTERSVLHPFRYAPNRAVVHGDTTFMPRRRRAWASWNAMSADAPGAAALPVAVTYWMNRLQGIDERHPVLITLNPSREPEDVIDDVWFSHPQFTSQTDIAQRRLPDIQGAGGVWHCGAWTGYGFHEDGLQSGLTVAAALGSPAPWHDDIVPASPAAANAAPRSVLR